MAHQGAAFGLELFDTLEKASAGHDVDMFRSAAFLYGGRWVADCGLVTCQGAELAQGALFSGQAEPDATPWSDAPPGMMIQLTRIRCVACTSMTVLEWPDADTFNEINRLMAFRQPVNRNWAPAWTRQGVLSGLPTGQSVEELAEENRQHGLGA